MEKTVGYGGLIHNFKNHVLRPNESTYRTQTLEDYETAIALIRRLENLQLPMMNKISLRETRVMVESYSERLAAVTQMAQQGASAREIDAVVRYDDSPALDELQTVLTELQTQTLQAIDTINKRALLQGLLALIICLVMLLLIGVWTIYRQKILDQQQLQIKITENNELLKRNTILQKFAGIVAHDLKAPERIISFHLDKLLTAQEAADKHEQRLQTIKSVNKKTVGLIDSLLAFSKSGYQNPKPAVVNLQKLVNEIKQELAQDSAWSRASIDAENLPDLWVDRELMKRVLVNVITNGIKYNAEPAAAVITLDHRQTHGQDIIQIKDNGIGIDSRYAEKIFEPMERLHGAGSGYEGFGLGLFLVKSIIDAHGGSITLDTDYTPGSCFVIRLPIVNT